MGELLSIVEQQCVRPTINARVFPGVSESYERKAKYWSATPMKELPGMFYNLETLWRGSLMPIAKESPWGFAWLKMINEFVQLG